VVFEKLELYNQNDAAMLQSYGADALIYSQINTMPKAKECH